MMFSTVRGNPCARAATGPQPRATRSATRRMGTLRRAEAALMCAALTACTSAERPLRLGTTTTVEQSGALAVLDSLAHPAPSTVVGPSGQVLAAAARGDLDLVLTHAPSPEEPLLAA